MTQYNPNPNGTSSTSGWSASSGVTLTATADGLRIRKSAGSGKTLVSPTMSLPSAVKTLRISTLWIRRNTAASDTFAVGGADWSYGSVRLQYQFLGDWEDKGYGYVPLRSPGAAGTFVLFRHYPAGGWETSSSGYPHRLVFLLGSGALDITIKGVNVHDDATRPTDGCALDSSDAGATFSIPANSLTVTAQHDGLNNEEVAGVRWGWGDASSTDQSAGAGAKIPAVSHTYPRAGIYNVDVFVKPGDQGAGFSGSSPQFKRTYTITVPSGTFTANFTYETDFLSLAVDGSASIAPSVDPVDTYAWDWGDGTTTAASTSKYGSHTYTAPGTYNVKLTTKTNATLRTSTTTKAVTVIAAPNPDNYFVVSRDLLTATFTPSILDGSSYLWDFGDGSSSTLMEPSHTYETPGTYSVTLTVNGTLTVTQSVTITDAYQPIGHLLDALRLEVAIPKTGPRNLIKNPSGELGAWGWWTLLSGSYITGSATSDQPADKGVVGPKLIYRSSGTGNQWARSGQVRAVAGQYVAAQVNVPYVDGYFRILVDALDANSAVLGSSTISGYQTASPTAVVRTGPYLLPAGTAYVRMAIRHIANTSDGVPAAGKLMIYRRAMIAAASTSAALASIPYAEGQDWQDLIGPTSEISVDRSALDLGTLTATILDSTFDPATSGTIRPGQDCRLRVKTPDGQGNTRWEPIFTGTVGDPDVEYVAAKGSTVGPKLTRIKLTAYDAVNVLSQWKRSQGVAKIKELPEILEGIPVPYVVNASTGQLPTGVAIVNANENASVLDQVAVTRDSDGGYAYVSREGVLNVREPEYMPTTPAGTLDEAVYSGVSAGFNLEDTINSVTVKWLRYSAASGSEPAKVEEVAYGPYTDESSVEEWGLRSATYTMLGVENPTNIAARAADILSANSQPVRMVTGVTVPIRYVEDLARSKALLDLYDLTRLKYARTDTDELTRITSIRHIIKATKDGGTWRMALGFSADGTVASPQVVAQPPVANTSTGLPFAARRASAAQSVPNATITPLTTDVSDGMTGGVTYASGAFTAPRGGVYMVTARVGWVSNTTGVRLLYVKRGSSYLARFSGSLTGTVGAIPVLCSAGDTIGVDVYQTSGAALNTDPGAGNVGYAVVFQGEA